MVIHTCQLKRALYHNTAKELNSLILIAKSKAEVRNRFDVDVLLSCPTKIADEEILPLTVCIAEVGIFIAAFRPVVMIIKRCKVECTD